MRADFTRQIFQWWHHVKKYFFKPHYENRDCIETWLLALRLKFTVRPSFRKDKASRNGGGCWLMYGISSENSHDELRVKMRLGAWDKLVYLVFKGPSSYRESWQVLQSEWGPRFCYTMAYSLDISRPQTWTGLMKCGFDSLQVTKKTVKMGSSQKVNFQCKVKASYSSTAALTSTVS